jgi:hypothetical protein
VGDEGDERHELAKLISDMGTAIEVVERIADRLEGVEFGGFNHPNRVGMVRSWADWMTKASALIGHYIEAGDDDANVEDD